MQTDPEASFPTLQQKLSQSGIRRVCRWEESLPSAAVQK